MKKLFITTAFILLGMNSAMGAQVFMDGSHENTYTERQEKQPVIKGTKTEAPQMQRGYGDRSRENTYKASKKNNTTQKSKKMMPSKNGQKKR